MTLNFSIEPCLKHLPTKLIISPDTEVGSAFASLQNTHDAMIVKGKKGEFLGIISPSQSFFNARYPYHTKAKRCLIKPAKVTKDTPIWETAREMLAKHIYTLPIIEKNGEVQYIITAKQILNCLLQDKTLLSEVSLQAKIQPAVTLPITTTVNEAFEVMRDKNVSRVILIDEAGKAIGISTRADLRDAFSQPTPRQRYTSKDGNPADFTFDDEEIYRIDAPITNFCTTTLFTAPDTLDPLSLLIRLLHAPRTSVVIVDSDKRPVGVLSTKNILEAITNLQPQEEIPLQVLKPQGIPVKESERVVDVAHTYLHKLHRKHPVMNADLTFKQAKSTAQHILDVEAKLQVKLKNGTSFIAHGNERSHQLAMREAIQELDRQVERKMH